jgi:Holliday junction resolvasome RuvABC endonuclease subunit
VTRILGVDPGATGALALLDTDTGELTIEDVPVIVVKAASRRRQTNEISESHLAEIVQQMSPDVAWVERVHSMPKQGVASSFSFGLAYGVIRGVLGALLVPMLFVTPNEWKREFRVTNDKGQSRVLAGRLYPNNASVFSRARDDGRAEAALIATFGARYPL